MGEAGVFESLNGAQQTALAEVVSVVVGGAEQIEAAPFQFIEAAPDVVS